MPLHPGHGYKLVATNRTCKGRLAVKLGMLLQVTEKSKARWTFLAKVPSAFACWGVPFQVSPQIVWSVGGIAARGTHAVLPEFTFPRNRLGRRNSFSEHTKSAFHHFGSIQR